MLVAIYSLSMCCWIMFVCILLRKMYINDMISMMMTIMQGKKASGFTPSEAEVTGKNISAIAHDGPGTGMTQNQEQGTCHHDL